MIQSTSPASPVTPEEPRYQPRRPVFRKIMRFGLVGVVGAVVDFTTMALLLFFGSPSAVARGSSYIIGSTMAYFVNSYVTFNGKRTRSEKLRAAVSYVACFIVAVLVNGVMRHSLPSLPNLVFWSWFVSQGVATTLNFLLQNFWVFRRA
ncbi:GtrA family protein [Corynebacterium sp. CNJ-954]|uniref:GtrA family protein n=1 Tax=Corynebacterium sp. CNJ-954 TaxID=1904962 RepID=UPI0021015C9E|nr:GtrA family protein [Corynebacterium sp. CNJ-954]